MKKIYSAMIALIGFIILFINSLNSTYLLSNGNYNPSPLPDPYSPDVTYLEVQNDLAEHLKSNNMNIVIGSKQYYDYLYYMIAAQDPPQKYAQDYLTLSPLTRKYYETYADMYVNTYCSHDFTEILKDKIADVSKSHLKRWGLLNTDSDVSKLVSWGEQLKRYKDRTALAKPLPTSPSNSNILYISQLEVDQYTDFYLLQGESKEEACNQAIHYAKERTALYNTAVSLGFTVSDEEVNDYLRTLRESADNSDTKNEVYAVMSAFDSIEEYWEYQEIIARKDLPIGKYVRNIQKTYFDNLSTDPDTGSDSGWESYFHDYKDKLIDQYQFEFIDTEEV